MTFSVAFVDGVVLSNGRILKCRSVTNRRVTKRRIFLSLWIPSPSVDLLYCAGSVSCSRQQQRSHSAVKREKDQENNTWLHAIEWQRPSLQERKRQYNTITTTTRIWAAPKALTPITQEGTSQKTKNGVMASSSSSSYSPTSSVIMSTLPPKRLTLTSTWF